MNERKSPSPANDTARADGRTEDIPRASDDGFLYDTVLTQVDAARGALVFHQGELIHRVATEHVGFFMPGVVGRLRLPTNPDGFAFHMYADQRLRRAIELDAPSDNKWGWRINERTVFVRAGLLPGRSGQVVPDDTEIVALAVPREFLNFCQIRGLTPETVLRAFVADVSGIMNLFVCPREDGYSSNGSDERLRAKEYFHRTFGWVDEPDHRARVRAAKRGTKKEP